MKLRLHSAGDASPPTALLLPQIFPILHPTVHKTHGGGPALRSSRRSAGVPTARTLRRGVDQWGASPPSVRRRSFTTDCSQRSSPLVRAVRQRRPSPVPQPRGLGAVGWRAGPPPRGLGAV